MNPVKSIEDILSKITSLKHLQSVIYSDSPEDLRHLKATLVGFDDSRRDVFATRIAEDLMFFKKRLPILFQEVIAYVERPIESKNRKPEASPPKAENWRGNNPPSYGRIDQDPF